MFIVSEQSGFIKSAVLMHNRRAQGLPMNTVVIIVLVILVLAGVGYIFFTYSSGGQSSFTQANESVASGAQGFSRLGTPWSAPILPSCKGTVDCDSYKDDTWNCNQYCSKSWSTSVSGHPELDEHHCDGPPKVLCSSKTTEASCKLLHGCRWDY